MDEGFFKKRGIEKKLTKQAALDTLAKQIEESKGCKDETVGKLVPGEGNPDALLMFVGEAPGRKEAATGRPFVGRSGKVLRSSMEKIGINPDEVFITSVGKYLPTKGTPSLSQIQQCREYLLTQIEIINPTVVVLLGKVAYWGIFQEKISVQEEHGTLRKKEGRLYFLTLHPAAALRFPRFRQFFAEDFEKLKKLLKDY